MLDKDTNNKREISNVRDVEVAKLWKAKDCNLFRTGRENSKITNEKVEIGSNVLRLEEKKTIWILRSIKW